MNTRFVAGVSIPIIVLVLLVGAVLRRSILQGAPSPVGAQAATPTQEAPARLSLTVVAEGFGHPVDLHFVPGQQGRAWLLEKGGRLLSLDLNGNKTLQAADASPLVKLPVHTASELGLLGIAFHPAFVDSGLFYLNHNPDDDGALRTQVSEWKWAPTAAGAATGSATQTRIVLEVEQPFRNHDGGGLAFGPDGYLYVGMGDGGHRADPEGNGQNLTTLLGSMLRLDVSPDNPSTIPSDNPFVGQAGARPEIWAYGLRNPWRFTFDPAGRLIVADVGQDLYEEIDIVERGNNLGWSTREAAHCFEPADGCATQGMTDPIYEYGRELGQSVTGGHVYLGTALPWLKGKYVFADHVSGRVWALEIPNEPKPNVKAEMIGRFPYAISGFARDAQGELYALAFNQGKILKLSPP